MWREITLRKAYCLTFDTMTQLFSIKNNTVTTIENCEDEPIQVPGTIQPHGFLIAFDKKGKIVFCSENVEQFLGVKVADILSKDRDEALPSNFKDVFKQYNTLVKKELQVPHTITVNDNSFDCFLKASDDLDILECVITTEHPYNVYEVLEHTNELVKQANNNIDLKTLCQLVTKKIHDITGYDRVMVYRFDEDYNGEVFAETVVNKHEPFLGLHYPHTDIPVQARKLYLKNMMRVIVDIDYKPIPIVTYNKDLAQPEKLDMSNVHLRSVSPIHVEYLKNMGVNATFTISLLKEDKLWGLIACHHYSDKNLSYIKQIQAFLLTQILSSQLIVQETAEKYKLSRILSKPMHTLTQKLANGINFKEQYFKSLPEVLQIVRASGAVLINRDKVYSNGQTPSDEQVLELNKWLKQKNTEEYHTHELITEYPKAKDFEKEVGGLLYFKVITSEVDVSLIYFKPPLNKVIKWAGEPKTKKGIEKLTPRNSFDEWKQLVKDKSDNWHEAEIDTAFQFVYSLQQHLFRVFLKEEEYRIKKLNEQLIKANKELENINWISTHDLREPLRKIQMFASMIDKPKKEREVFKVETSVNKIQRAAVRMQKLLDDLLEYSRMAKAKEVKTNDVDLNEIVAEVKENFKEDYESGTYRIKNDELPTVKGNFFQLQQLFINLIDNSIKFKAEDRMQEISIEQKKTKNNIVITICDTGVGFNPKLDEKVFEIFKKGHINNELHGTGIGLSICKKIMENHGGTIKAKGKEGKGACFKLYFPI